MDPLTTLLPTAPSNRLIGLCGPDADSRAKVMATLSHSYRYRPVSVRMCIAAQACMRWRVPLNTFITPETHEQPQEKLALCRCDSDAFLLHLQSQQLGIDLQVPRTPAEIMHWWRQYRGCTYWHFLLTSRAHLLLQPPHSNVALDASTPDLQRFVATAGGELWHIGSGYTPQSNFHVQRVGDAWMCDVMPREAVDL
ncbi:MAG: hypothetical protein PHX60_13540 [Giesbergeria sp.]|uniref:hypothetical protein n=1 Tax=Giesbergeria sp. TaxID=2818473 RepID=UPI002639B48C|nr:hypothetical protein [Giesbergeria sp.]MDD2610683.1 hypothetical protein [Giesbergeria sp.]